ncbi:MAG: choice-of-anchor tandem repeat NxxGxxAF-containing protein [Planctomycetota bacterium]
MVSVVAAALVPAASGQVYLFTPVVQEGDQTQLGSRLDRDLRVSRLLPGGGALLTCDVADGRTGLWLVDRSGQRLIAAEGEPAPGFGTGSVFGSRFFRAEVAATTGAVLFDAIAAGSSGGGSGAWLSLADGTLLPVLLGGQAVPTVSGATIGDVSVQGINASGEGVVLVEAERPGQQDAAVVFRVAPDGTATPAATDGDPTDRPGETFFSIRWAGIDDAGNVYVQGFSEGFGFATGIWRIDPTGAVTSVVRTSDDAPGLPPTTRFNVISEPDLASNGDMLFRAVLFRSGGTTADTDEGIWRVRGGVIEQIMREGDPAPGLPAGAVFADVNDAITSVQDDGTYSIEVEAEEFPVGGRQERRTFWYAPADGDATLMYRTNDPVPAIDPGYQVVRAELGRLDSDGTVFIGLPRRIPATVIRRDPDGTEAVEISSALAPWTAVGVSPRAFEPLTMSFVPGADPGTMFLQGRLDTGNGETVVWYGELDPDHCFADTNRDGLLSPADFNAWVTGYNERFASCDQNNDGLCTPADFNAWVINFNDGCP